MASKDLSIKLRIDADGTATVQQIGNVRQSVDSLSPSMDKVGASAEGMLKSIVGIGAGAFAIDRIVSSVSDWVDAANVQSRAETQLAQTMRHVAGASDEEIAALKDLASTQQDLTGYGDEATIQAQAYLATFGLTAAEIAKLTPRMLDLAEAQRQAGAESVDLKAIANQLGKAFANESAAGLREYGVTLTKAQEAQLAQATGMEKVSLLAQVLDGNFGGLAAAVGADYEGATRKAAAAEGDLAEALGRVVTQSASSREAIGAYTDLLKGVTAAVDENAGSIRTLVGDAGMAALPALLALVGSKLAGYVQAQLAAAASQRASAEAAQVSAAQEVAAAKAKELGAKGTLTLAVAAQTEAKAILASVEARALEMPYLVRTATYQKELAAARAASVAATTALTAAQNGLIASERGLAAAQEAQLAASRAGQLGLKDLLSSSTLLKAGMTAMISLEVGRWLRGIAEDSQIGRAGIALLDDAIGSLSETYRLATEAERNKAEVDERAAAKLKEVAQQTGVAVKSMEDFNAKVAAGELVWNAQTRAWEKGVAIAKTLAQGLGDADTAYARIADVLERVGKQQSDLAKADEAAAKAAAARAKALGDEQAALGIVVEATTRAVDAAQHQVDIQRALLIDTETRIEQLQRESTTNQAGAAARQAMLDKLDEEASKRKAALAAAEAAATQAATEMDQARILAQTYGDQSAALDDLIARRDALASLQERDRRAMESAVVASGQLAAAQQRAADAARAYTDALVAGSDDLDALAAQSRAANLAVSELEGQIRMGTEAATRAAVTDRELAIAKAAVADAAKDAAKNTDLQIQANQRELTIAQARIALHSDETQKLIGLAQERGDLAEAQRLNVQLIRDDTDATLAAADAKLRDAELLREKAKLLEIAAKATGDYTAEELAQVQAAKDAAEMADIEAQRLALAAEAKDRAADAASRLADAQEALRAAFESAGIQGVQSMSDIRSAVNAAATGPELEALAEGLRSAIAAGVDEAGNLSQALDDALGKLDELEAREKGIGQSVQGRTFEDIYAEYGKDVTRAAKSLYRGMTLADEQMRKTFEANYRDYLASLDKASKSSAKTAQTTTATSPQTYSTTSLASRAQPPASVDEAALLAAARERLGDLIAAAKTLPAAPKVVDLRLSVPGAAAVTVQAAETDVSKVLDVLRRAGLVSA